MECSLDLARNKSTHIKTPGIFLTHFFGGRMAARGQLGIHFKEFNPLEAQAPENLLGQWRRSVELL